MDQFRIYVSKERLKREIQKREKEQEALNYCTEQYHLIEDEINSLKADVIKSEEWIKRIKDKEQEMNIIRRNDDAALRYRQWTLLNDMSRIYPITLKEEQVQTLSKEKEKNKAKEKIKPAKRVLCINGIPLPDADSYAGEDEEQIAAALGMTSRLVLLIAKIFQIELYYTPLPLGSKSLIKEGKSDSNATKFPLYLRGVDLKRFNRAVFLLNKDIEQIAKILQTYQQDFSLPSTLSNLHTIFVKAAQECKNIG